MAVHFVDGSTGNDANDKLDNIGVGLATATWTESTLTLTQSTHGYTFATGDVIFIESGTGVSQTGLYEVVSSTANNIVLAATSSLEGVQDANDFAAGDLATGDIVSSDGPLLTVDAAMNAVAAGDKVWVRSTADFTETATIDTEGTAAAPITFEGYTTSLGDNGQATIKGSTDGITQTTGTAHYYLFRNFIITGHSDKGVDFTSVGDNVRLENCNIHTNSGIGVAGDNDIYLSRCKIQNNGGRPILIDASGMIFGCTISGNVGGIAAQNTTPVLNSLIYDNTNAGSAAAAVRWDGGNTNVVGFIIGNTVDGDASSVAGTITLLECNAADFRLAFIYNNIIFDGNTGIIMQTPDRWGRVMDYNVVDDITGTKRTFITAGDNDIDDPTTIGLNADYTLTSASEAKAAGLDAGLLENGASFIDIGALQREEPAGGSGGGCKQAGSSGGMVG